MEALKNDLENLITANKSIEMEGLELKKILEEMVKTNNRLAEENNYLRLEISQASEGKSNNLTDEILKY